MLHYVLELHSRLYQTINFLCTWLKHGKLALHHCLDNGIIKYFDVKFSVFWYINIPNKQTLASVWIWFESYKCIISIYFVACEGSLLCCKYGPSASCGKCRKIIQELNTLYLNHSCGNCSKTELENKDLKTEVFVESSCLAPSAPAPPSNSQGVTGTILKKSAMYWSSLRSP